jgi:membrane associated rhomboid family serine protease
MMLIPLTDASRRPTRVPVVTACIIALNALMFVFELAGGETFVKNWSLVPADIAAGRHWITILTAMFMHGSWSHIIGNMIFLWAFGPEVEDLMGRGRYLVFYLLGGVVAALAQVAVAPDSTVPNLGASGAIAAVMGAFLVTFPQDRIRSLLVIFVFVRGRLCPGGTPHRCLGPDPVPESRRRLTTALRRRGGLRRSRGGLHFRDGRRTAVQRGGAPEVGA